MIYANFVTIGLDTPIYLTDFHRDFQYNGKTYVSGFLKVDQPMKQTAEPSAIDFSITLSAVDSSLVSAFATSNYKGRQCLIERIEFNDDETVDSSEVWLDGEIDKYSFANKLKASTIKLTVGSIFAVFKKIRRADLNILFADTINDDQTLFWGKESSVTNTISGGGVGGGGGTTRPEQRQEF